MKPFALTATLLACVVILAGCATKEVYRRMGTTVETVTNITFSAGATVTSVTTRVTYESPLLDAAKSIGDAALKSGT